MAGCSRTVSPRPIPCQGDSHSIPEGHGIELQLTLPSPPEKVAPRALTQGRPLLDTPKVGWARAQSGPFLTLYHLLPQQRKKVSLNEEAPPGEERGCDSSQRQGLSLSL